MKVRLNLGTQRGIHAAQLERLMGEQLLQRLSDSVKAWYGPPIRVMLPGAGMIYACGGGDFRGTLKGGGFASYFDRLRDGAKRNFRRWARDQMVTAHANSFGSLSDLIVASSTAGKYRVFNFNKNGPTGVAAASSTLWRVGTMPAAGGQASNAPGGRACDDTTTGAYPFTNPTSGLAQFLTQVDCLATTTGPVLLLYDRCFDVNKTMNSTSTEAVSSTAHRYDSITTTAFNYAMGNFLFIECFAALPATAHNWTVCTYTDQDGNTGATLPSVTGNSSCIIDRFDQPIGQWFCPLATGDTGIRYLTQMQCSALVASGNIQFVIGHPYCFMPFPTAFLVCPWDGITRAELPRIADDACIAMIDVCKVSTTATTYTGMFKSTETT